jgi:hypothetical protein
MNTHHCRPFSSPPLSLPTVFLVEATIHITPTTGMAYDVHVHVRQRTKERKMRHTLLLSHASSLRFFVHTLSHTLLSHASSLRFFVHTLSHIYTWLSTTVTFVSHSYLSLRSSFTSTHFALLPTTVLSSLFVQHTHTLTHTIALPTTVLSLLRTHTHYRSANRYLCHLSQFSPCALRTHLWASSGSARHGHVHRFD